MLGHRPDQPGDELVRIRLGQSPTRRRDELLGLEVEVPAQRHVAGQSLRKQPHVSEHSEPRPAETRS